MYHPHQFMESHEPSQPSGSALPELSFEQETARAGGRWQGPQVWKHGSFTKIHLNTLVSLYNIHIYIYMSIHYVSIYPLLHK